MSRNPYSVARSAHAGGNAVRRDAYERAMQILNGRPGVSATLTAEQQAIIQDFDGPEIIGNRARLPVRRNADAS